MHRVMIRAALAALLFLGMIGFHIDLFDSGHVFYEYQRIVKGEEGIAYLGKPPLDEEELNRGMALANDHYLSYGITSLQEATVGNDISQWQTFHRFIDTDKLKSRVSMMFGIDSLSQFQETGLTPRSGDSRLRLGGIKIMLNETTGSLQPPQPELNQQAFNAHKTGFQLAIHGIEPGTVEAAIAALEYAHSHLPRADRRHRLEHCSVCPPPLLERLVKLQAVIVTQPPFIYYNGERYLSQVPADQLPWLYRIKSFIDNGLVVAGSSDSPVAIDNPSVGIYAAVARCAESGQQLLPQERISAEQAIAMYTTNAAFASFEEDIKGSITPGKLADIVVLSNDPIRLPPEQIKDIRVEMTIIGGKVAWEA